MTSLRCTTNVDFADLQIRVSRFANVDLKPLFADYQARSGSSDMDGFVSFLRTSRVIDETQLKDLLTGGGVEIPTAGDLGFAGTILSAPQRARMGEDATVVTPSAPQGRGAGAVSTVSPALGVAAGAAAPQVPPERYHAIAVLGEGAMGAVSIARDMYLRRKVALKTVLPEMSTHPELLGRFLAEMQITAQLDHPNIVPIYAMELRSDGSFGYAMKLVQGSDLAGIIDQAREMVQKGQPLDEERSFERRIDVFLKVCDAVEFAHSKGIVHRDLKPANIMVGRHNEVYLMDWGISRPMGEGGQALEAGIELQNPGDAQANDGGRTCVGSMIGTPVYMSPEQADGRNAELDGRSDQYAMGLILQECVTLERAVQGNTLQEIITKAKEARRDPVKVGEKHGDVPPEIEAIVRKATQLRPQDRYPSVRALADDVRRFLRNEEVSVLRDSTLRKASRWVSKHRTTSLMIMMSLALVGSLATIGSLVVGQSRVAAMHARELRVSEFQAESAIQAQLVDRELARFETSLSKFVGATQLVLSGKSSGGAPPYFAENLGQKGTGPSDFGASERYHKDVTILGPVVALSSGVSRESVDPFVRSLGVLSPAFVELMLDTASGDSRKMTAAEQRELIAGQGVPALYAIVALREGVTLTFPGGVGMPAIEGVPSEGQAGVHWETPVKRGSEVLLPALANLYDDKNVFRGVASLEVSLDRLLAQPGAAKLDYVQSKMLVSRAGEVIAEESGPGGRAPLSPEVKKAIAAGKSGSVEFEEGGRRWISTYYPLSSIDWYYVGTASVRTMMASESKVATSDPRAVASANNARGQSRVPRGAAAAAPAPATSVAIEAPDAGVDAGDDAGADAGDDAAAPPSKKRPAEKPNSKRPEPERNPFEKWKEYDKGKNK